jgi:hypothetical protein
MNGSESDINNCIIRRGTGGMTFENNAQVAISNSLASGIQDVIPSLYTSSGGFYALRCDQVQAQRIISHNNTVGVKIKDYCEAQVSNSYFALNNYGVESYASQTTIANNVLERNTKYDIRVCGDEMDPNITNNYLLSDKGLCIGLDINLNYYDCIPQVHDNNMNNELVAIHIIGFNRLDVDATMNYYYSVDSAEIAEKIIDQNDFVNNGHANMVIASTAYVNYLPFMYANVTNCGIIM